MTNRGGQDTDFAALRRHIVAQGLLDTAPVYYWRKLGAAAVLLVVSVTLVLTGENLAIRALAAVMLAVTFTQVGLVAHDAGHGQIFRSRRRNDLLGLILVNLVMGFGYSWWVDKHNRHHRHPNRPDYDPDISLPFLALSTGQLETKSPFQRFFIRNQAFLFPPFLLLVAYSLRLDSVAFLLRARFPYRTLEVALLSAHLILYSAGVIALLGVTHGLYFVAIHQGCLGLFLGSAFAANHKGMPMLDPGSSATFLWRQVVTTRNLRRHPVTDFWYGPLACQIEHHLFPRMPRCNLRKAAPIVRAFCESHGVPYHETGVVRAYTEILRHLHQVSGVLRRPRRERS